MKWVLSRRYGDKQTTGCLYVFDGEYSFFNCLTLELPWRNNQRNISCYPAGIYKVQKHKRPNGRWSFWVKDVPGRTAILFHAGNYIASQTSHSAGCTLVGFRYDDIDKDGIIDIVDSNKALQMLLDLMPDTEFELHVI